MQPYGWQPPPPRQTSSAGPLLAIVAVVGLVMILLGLGVGGFLWSVRRHASVSKPATATSTWSDSDSPVPVTSRDPMWGNRGAPITVVVFGDLDDGFASKLVTTLDGLKSLYGTGQLRIVWKHYPMPYHSNAHDAAEAAAGVRELMGDDAFWHFVERAVANRPSLGASSYEGWAAESGVDMRDFHDGLTTHRWAPKVDEDNRLATGLPASPSSAYINGIKVNGVQPVGDWEKVIDAELPKARVALSSGVTADRVYVVRSTDNYASAPPSPLPTASYAPPAVASTIHRVPIGTSPVRGKNDALVTIVEFGDFQCPFCARAEPTLAALRAKYGDDLRIVWKNDPLPFHPRAAPAAELAIEARQEKGDAGFWAAHDDLYASQGGAGLDDATLMRIAREHGVSETRAMAAVSSSKYKATIDADQKLSTTVGATGTPSFFINGRLLTGAQPVAAFEAVIDDEMVKARARVAKGTARSKIYDEIMTEAP